MRRHPVLADAFERVRDGVHGVCGGLPAQAMAWRPGPGANTIAWLVWHLGRVGDAQVAELAGRAPVWTEQGWHDRFALPFDVADTGYGHDPDQVARVRPDGTAPLVGYVDAVVDATLAYLDAIDDEDLDRVVDRSWDPPVTVRTRLVSILHDQSQHLGQAAYVRGLHERARPASS